MGLKFLVLHRLATPTQPLGFQLALAAALRIGTGSDQSPSEIVDMRLGPGDDRVDTRAVLDASYGRFGLLAAARYESALTSGEPVEVTTPAPSSPATDGSVTEISLAPRWHLSEPLSFHGAYSFRTADVTGTDQLVGGGFSFSGFRRTGEGRTPSMEMRYTHLEAISGAAGRPRFFRDQIELRIYYRLIR